MLRLQSENFEEIKGSLEQPRFSFRSIYGNCMRMEEDQTLAESGIKIPSTSKHGLAIFRVITYFFR